MAIWNSIFGGGHQHSEDTIETMIANVAEGDAVVLDVRSQEERDAGYIENSIFIPFNEFETLGPTSELLSSLPKDKTVYCH